MNHFRRSFPALLFYLLYINSVTCQEVISKNVGEDALLTCVYKDPVPDSVFWRINDSISVFDIIKQQPSTSKQIKRYENRVSSFPEEYKNGNFSIKIKKLEVDDTNVYECRPDESKLRTVKLIVSGIEPLGGAAASNLLSVVLLFAISLLICF